MQLEQAQRRQEHSKGQRRAFHWPTCNADYKLHLKTWFWSPIKLEIWKRWYIHFISEQIGGVYFSAQRYWCRSAKITPTKLCKKMCLNHDRLMHFVEHSNKNWQSLYIELRLFFNVSRSPFPYLLLCRFKVWTRSSWNVKVPEKHLCADIHTPVFQ